MLLHIDKFLNSFERDNNTIESAQENLKTQSIMYYDLHCIWSVMRFLNFIKRNKDYIYIVHWKYEIIRVIFYFL